MSFPLNELSLTAADILCDIWSLLPLHHLAKFSFPLIYCPRGRLTRIFHELLSRDHEDGRATGQPQGVGFEAYLNSTSQSPTPEDARKNGHIRGRSK